MTKIEEDLFNGLNKLCDENEAFYFSEQDYNNTHIIRSFTYRLASWTEFQKPYALDCRGTAFIFDKETNKWSLFTRAYRKFFNLGEGVPKEDYIKYNTPLHSFEKLDGSLILVGLVNNTLVAKSKTSINSVHAKLANELIQENKKLQEYLTKTIKDGYTPVMELVGPGDFRIVLNYDKNELIWLGKVKHFDYKVHTVNYEPEKFKELSGIRCAGINKFSWKELENIQETAKPDIEGFVVQTELGFVKCKVQSYVHLHHLKDNVNNMKNLIALILSDDLDDLMGNFQDDTVTMDMITQTQDKINTFFNHLVKEFYLLRAEYFTDYNENRKNFALAKRTNPNFGGAMKSLNVPKEDLEKFAEESVKNYILKQCNTLGKAQEFVKSLAV